MMPRQRNAGYTLIEFLVVAWIPMVILCLAGYITHIITCIQEELWFLLIAGCIAFPIGVVHGIGVWFGAF